MVTYRGETRSAGNPGRISRRTRQQVVERSTAAERAMAAQGPNPGRVGRPELSNNLYPGRDSYQNGYIEKGSGDLIYTSNWGPGTQQSGYFTDKATVDSCSKNGVLDSNKLGETLQTAPSNLTSGDGSYQHKGYCTAYKIDWAKLEETKSKDPQLYRSLANDRGDIVCAYGKVKANPQHGPGGGNQYHIEKDSFNKAVERGIFREDPKNSFSEKRGNLTRQNIGADSRQMRESKDKLAQVFAKESQSKSLSKQEINSYQAPFDPKMPYIAKADRNNSQMPIRNQARSAGEKREVGMPNKAAFERGGQKQGGREMIRKEDDRSRPQAQDKSRKMGL